MTMRGALFVAVAALAAGCVSFPEAPTATTAPRIEAGRAIVADGAALGLQSWPAAAPRAIVVAVHGMNDHGGAWATTGPLWAMRGISTYAYDQRGFGRSPDFGRWAGGATLKSDLRAVLAAARRAHPGLPLYVVGHSMGASVVLAAMKDAPLDVDGAILAAPAVWGGAGMPILYRASANLAAMVAPGKTLTGESAGRQASDNLDVLRALYEDPLVIKATRLDAVLGVVRIMGEAHDAADETGGEILFLYGLKDEIIPPKLMARAAARLCGAVETRTYAEGWHLLFRDLGGALPANDAADWIERDLARKTPQAATGERRACGHPER